MVSSILDQHIALHPKSCQRTASRCVRDIHCHGQRHVPAQEPRRSCRHRLKVQDVTRSSETCCRMKPCVRVFFHRLSSLILISQPCLLIMPCRCMSQRAPCVQAQATGSTLQKSKQDYVTFTNTSGDQLVSASPSTCQACRPSFTDALLPSAHQHSQQQVRSMQGMFCKS